MKRSILALTLIVGISSQVFGKEYATKKDLVDAIKQADKNVQVLNNIEKNLVKQLGCSSAEGTSEKFLKCVLAQLSKPSSEIDGPSQQKIVKACCVTK